MKVLLLASGAGSLARAICEARIPIIEIVGLISDKQCPALSLADEFNFAHQLIPMQADRKQWNSEMIEAVRILSPDLVVSVGFMRILSSEFLNQFQVINSHPALLPSFPGAHAVRDALAANARVTGATVHWVDEGVDTGPIIAQREIAIEQGDDESSLHERIKIIERHLIVETLTRFALDGIPENR
jgi:phosphoribosylglycinamide formyltransferase-1